MTLFSLLSTVTRRPAAGLLCALLFAAVTAPASAAAGEWTLREVKPRDIPGETVEIRHNGDLVARFVYGEGQVLPYLALYGNDGRQLTNPGMDAGGNVVGSYPHHRGIFLGWRNVKSELGEYNLWALSASPSARIPPGTMTVHRIEKMSATRDAATLVVNLHWRSPNQDAAGNNLLLEETRTLVITRPDNKATQVDTRFTLKAARDLTLDGDVQHAGIHFRAHHDVAESASQTTYLWAPEHPAQPGKVAGSDLQWGQFLFPLGGRWYTALQMSAPKNPVEEFSTREYGRFGFFFKKDLKKNETLNLDYRFLVQEVPAPADLPKRSAREEAQARQDAAAAYRKYVSELGGR